MIIRAVESGPRGVHELAELTGTTAITLRRDLSELAERGALRRTRGGAEAATGRGLDFPFELRRGEAVDLKRALARAAASRVRPGDCVLIDNGTTALAVAEELAGRGVTALALSIHAAAALAKAPGNQIVVPGGTVATDDLRFTGSTALRAVEAMRFDVAFLGACAADPETGLTVAEYDDAHLKRAALASSRSAVLVATPDKFLRTSAHHFGSIADLDAIVTGDPVPASVTAAAAAAGVELVVADAG